jgi:predicted dehydrogenase
VNQNSRNKPSFLRVQEIVESGVLGRVLQIRMAFQRFSRRWDWQTLREFAGGLLNNQGAHIVDRALLLLGDVEPQVFCRMERTPLYAGDAESHVKIILQGDTGPMIDIELTTACAYPQESWHIMGTQGGLTGTEQTLRWKYFDPASLAPRPLDRQPTPDRSYNREDLPWREETFDCSADADSGYRKVYMDLHAALRREAPLAITPESVRRQIAVIDKCHELGGI